jgi:Ca-activated chloride channel homolog
MTRSIIILILLVTVQISAQRSIVNKGVDQYKEGKYTDAEINFRKGIEKAPENFQARFNLGDAFYKQGKFDESVNEFYSSLELTNNPVLKAKVHHNIGNSLLKAQKIRESVEAYKNSLKLNPADMETKYNLSYALSLLDKNQKQQQDNQNQQSQEQQDQDQNENQDQNNQNQPQNDQNKPPQDEQAQQDNLRNQENQIPKEEAERILQALKNNEQEIQKKLRQKTGPAVKREKDW